MMCTSCTMKKICCVYKFRKEHEDDVVMSISECKYKTGKLDTCSISTDVSSMLAEQFDEVEYQKFLMKQNGTTVKSENEIMQCPTCDGQDYTDMMTICSKCGKPVCGNCGTSDEGLTYCKKCWEDI